MIKTLTLILLFSLFSHLPITIAKTFSENNDVGFSIGQNQKGKGEMVYVDSRIWNKLPDQDGCQVYKSVKAAEKLNDIQTKIVKFDPQTKNVVAVASFSGPSAMKYETREEMYDCNFNSEEKNVSCNAYLNQQCEALNSEIKTYFGNQEKMKTCTSALMTISESTHGIFGELNKNGKDEIKKYTTIAKSAHSAHMKGMDFDKFDKKPVSITNASIIFSGKEVTDGIRYINTINEVINFCKRRGFLEEEKNESPKTSSPPPTSASPR